jgi:hypothetical protein
MKKKTKAKNPFTTAKAFMFPSVHSGKNPHDIWIKAEPSGDPGLYQEIAVSANIRADCIADVIVGLNEHGELRVLLTMANQGDGDKKIAVFPQRHIGAAIEYFD